MDEILNKPPSGTRDFLPEEVKRRSRIFSKATHIFESFGYAPMETPAIERIETLMGKYGEEGEKLIFKILKRGEREESGETDLALRYDLTIPLARFFAAHQAKLPKIFRRYQIGPVWRADRPGKGRFREFTQCDTDIIGSYSLLADAEIILVMVRVLESLGQSDFIVHLNSRKILEALCDMYNISAEQKQDLYISLDKLDKIGAQGVEKELIQRGFPLDRVTAIREDLEGSVSRVKEKLIQLKSGKEGMREVEIITKLTAPFLKGGSVVFSPFLARGLDYYTGPIFEIFSSNLQSSIAAGGRYDDLIGIFSKKAVPACGGSLGIERVLMTAHDGAKKEEISADAFVAVWDETFYLDALRLAEEARAMGIKTEVYLGEGNIGKQLGHASDHNIRFCILFGPDEKEKDEVAIKDLQTEKQIRASRSQFPKTLKDLLKKRRLTIKS